MAKYVHNDVLDGALDILATADLMIACSAQPANVTEATTTYALADVAVTSGDFTNADGDSSGRKCTVAAKSGVTVDANGDATHIALVDTGGSRLLYVTTCTTQQLVSGSTVDFPAWDIEIADPS